MKKNGRPRVILDVDDISDGMAASLIRLFGNRIFAVKSVDFLRDMGWSVGKMLKRLGAPRIWIDAGLYGRPHTVRRFAAALHGAEVDIVTVHASAGVEIMKTIRDAGVQVYADTVLPSLGHEEVRRSYGRERPEDVVIAFAEMAEEAEAAGVVCLPHDIPLLKQLLVRTEIVAVDVRPAGSPETGRKRVGDLSMAVRHGADRLVIGGELIAEAPDPVVALQKIEEEIRVALRASKEEK